MLHTRFMAHPPELLDFWQNSIATIQAPYFTDRLTGSGLLAHKGRRPESRH